MRILILGHPGSGKTYLANKLSEKLGIEKIDIDVLFDRHPLYLIFKSLYGRALNGLIGDRNDWVIDGYHSGRMPDEILKSASKIIYLNLPKSELRQNILNRFRIKKAAKEFSHWQSVRVNNWKNFAQITFENKTLTADIVKIESLLSKDKGENFVELHSREEIENLIDTF